jgi:hypothetical protein
VNSGKDDAGLAKFENIPYEAYTLSIASNEDWVSSPLKMVIQSEKDATIRMVLLPKKEDNDYT